MFAVGQRVRVTGPEGSAQLRQSGIVEVVTTSGAIYPHLYAPTVKRKKTKPAPPPANAPVLVVKLDNGTRRNFRPEHLKSE